MHTRNCKDMQSAYVISVTISEFHTYYVSEYEMKHRMSEFHTFSSTVIACYDVLDSTHSADSHWCDFYQEN